MGGHALSHHRLSPTVRRRLNRCAGCGLAMAILLTAAVSWAATYRWVDEEGKVHYGDSIPPRYAGQGHTELNREGRVIRRIDRAPSSAEARQRRERESARKAAEEHEVREGQRRDSALLATYGSVKEIEQARARAVEQEQLLLEGLQVMRKQADARGDTAYIDEMISQREKSMDAVRTKYDADKARYLELTGLELTGGR